MRVFIAIMLTFILSAGCSNPKDANEANFTEAINAYLNESPLFLRTDQFPKEFDMRHKDYYENDLKNLEEWVAIGFLSKKEEKKEVPKQRLSLRNEMIETTICTYDLTELGKEIYVNDQFLMGFRFGTPQVAEIINFSEPAPWPGGEIVSSVNFTYNVPVIEDWVEETSFKDHSSIKEAKASLENPVKDKANLILTNKGWMHIRLFKENG